MQYFDKIKDKLQALSKKQIALLAGVGTLFLGFTHFAWKSGLFRKVVIQEKQISGQKIIYTQYQGEYHKIYKAYEQLEKDLKLFVNTKQYIGIYYDDPTSIKDHTKCRAIIGIVVDQNDYQLIDQFLQGNAQFQEANLPETQSVSTTVRFDRFVYFIVGWKIYAPLFEYTIRNQKIDRNDKLCAIEFCDGKTLQFSIPVGEEAKQYFLSKFEEPAHI